MHVQGNFLKCLNKWFLLQQFSPIYAVSWQTKYVHHFQGLGFFPAVLNLIPQGLGFGVHNILILFWGFVAPE